MAEYVRDDFNRTAGSGSPGSWSTPYIGGPWSVATSSSNMQMSVDGSRGKVAYVTGTGGNAYGLLSAALPALEAHGAANVRTNDPTLGFTAYLWFRANGTASTFAGYGIRITRPAGATPAVLVELVRGTVDVPVVIATITTTGQWPTHTNYARIELEVLGANPTTVRGRWFLTASPPADDTGWTEVTDAVGPQAAGVYGSRATRVPANAVLDNVYYSDLYVADPLRVNFTTTFDDSGLTAIFDSATLTTGDPVQHYWNFGDGSSPSSAQNPSHVYAAAGTYSVSYTAFTRWGTQRKVTTSVVVPGGTALPVPDIRPAIYINGEDVCDRVYSANWQTGRDRWPDETNGSSVTLSVRGRMADVVMGAPVVIALPPGHPDGTKPLFTGEVDSITESIEPVEGETVTSIIAMDVLAFLGRWHILPNSTFAEGGLPTRITALAPRGTTVYRPKWTGVPSGRWPVLKSLTSSADKLRSRTYLDLLREGLRASLATAYVAPDGVVVYAPLDPPTGQGYSSRVLAGTSAPIPNSHWKLGEPTGTFVDSVGGFGGTVGGTPLRGTVPLAPGDIDGALGATASTSVSYGDLYNKGTGSRWTIAGWVSWSSGELYLFTKLTGSPFRGYRAQVTTAGTLRMFTGNNLTSLPALASTVALTPNTVHHVAFVWGLTTWDIYLDGLLVASAPRSAEPAANAGQVASSNLATGCVLDELSMWNVALTAAQVKALVAPGLNLDDSGFDCPSHEDLDRSTADGMVNRWTVGDGATVDVVQRASIEAYGESSWTVPTGVLKAESTFPLSDAVVESLREPFPAKRVKVPIRDWSARAYLAQPLDMATRDGQLYGILGVKQDIRVGEWSVELTLDRDPWTMTGYQPPAPAPEARIRTQTFDANKDALLASPNMGAGKATRLPVGLWSGTKFRALIQFGLDWDHTPKRILKAELLLDTAGQDVCAYGSSPQIIIDRVTGSWNSGSSGGDGPPWTFNTSNAVVYPGPSCTSSGRQTANVTNNEDTPVTISITTITRAWADGSPNRGIRIMSTNEASTTRTIEFYSLEHTASSRRPQLRVEYEW